MRRFYECNIYIIIAVLPTRRICGPSPNIQASYAAYRRSMYINRQNKRHK